MPLSLFVLDLSPGTGYCSVCHKYMYCNVFTPRLCSYIIIMLVTGEVAHDTIAPKFRRPQPNEHCEKKHKKIYNNINIVLHYRVKTMCISGSLSVSKE